MSIFGPMPVPFRREPPVGPFGDLSHNDMNYNEDKSDRGKGDAIIPYCTMSDELVVDEERFRAVEPHQAVRTFLIVPFGDT